MEYDLNQWRNHQLQFEQQQQHSTKIPRLFLDDAQDSNIGSSSVETALPLFVPEPNNKITTLSAFPDSITTYKFHRLGGGLFSLGQWQELELQALIFKYMLAGAPIPLDLLQSIKKSFFNSPASCLHYPNQQHYQHYQATPNMYQSGYWVRGSIDPEPGRCRRTDGKKWRCSRDIVPGQKYCERHVHRGRNRSRKPVEIPTPASAGAADTGLKISHSSAVTVASTSSSTAVANRGHSLPGSSSTDLLHLSQRPYEDKVGNGFLVERNSEKFAREGNPDGQILRHFFDDWPRSDKKSQGSGQNSSPATSTTCLSISTPANNPSSDFSLKLSTGHTNEFREAHEGNEKNERTQLNWGAGWGTNQVSSIGGPLAEALRSSTTNSSPTSVLIELRPQSISRASSLST